MYISNNMFRRTLSTLNKKNLLVGLFEDLAKITSYNLSHLESIDITINNPMRVSRFNVFNTHIFEARLNFQKEDFRFTKKFLNNEPDLLVKDIKSFVEKEIKL